MNILSRSLGSAALLALVAGSVHAAQDTITKKPFGKAPSGQAVSLYTLTNKHGAQVKITNYGGIVTSIIVPDRRGHLGDVALGFDNIEGYIKHSPVLRRVDRALRQPNRQRTLHSRRQKVHAGCQQRRQQPARRQSRL